MDKDLFKCIEEAIKKDKLTPEQRKSLAHEIQELMIRGV